MTPQLTQTQFSALKTVAQADPTAAGFITSGDDLALAGWFNTVDATYWVWRNRYTVQQMADAIDLGITQLDALTASKRDSLLWWVGRDHDASVPQARVAINDLCGSQNTLKNALLDGAKRNATRAEKVLAVQVQGTDTGSVSNPMKAAFEGAMSAAEASLVRVA